MSSTSTSEVIENEELFEKHRGQRRWLGKEHHKGKDRLYDMVKDRVLIQKTIESSQPIGKNMGQKILNSTTDDLALNVCYSMDKKNRWMKVNNVNLLKCAPSNVKAEVVERNILNNEKAMGKLQHTTNDRNTTFAVHSKINVNGEDSEDFEIRSAISSGPAQNYSNFLPKCRELSKKSSKKQKNNSDESDVIENQPTVTYNIYKAHSSKEIVTGQLFVPNSRPKTKNRGTYKHFDDYSDFDYDSDFEEVDDSDCEKHDEDTNTYSKNIDLSQFIVDKSETKKPHQPKRQMEQHFDQEEGQKYESVFNVHKYLEENPHTFYTAESVTFMKIKSIDLKETSEFIKNNTNATVKFLKENQILIDANKFSCTEPFSIGEASIVIVVSQIFSNRLHFVINSTLPSDPANQNKKHLERLIGSSNSLYEAIFTICAELGFSKETAKDMKTIATLFNTKPVKSMLKSSDDWAHHIKKLNFEAENEHEKQACCTEMMSVGVKQEWDHICEMVRETNTSHTSTMSEVIIEKKRANRCSECSTHHQTFELFEVVGGARKCGDCLRNIFYREFRAERFPIDLEIIDPMGSNLTTFDFLPAFIPLPVFNLYTKKMFQSIYNDLGATGLFENCPNCKSTVYFEEAPSNSDRSCSCGFCWCSKCESAPHWPMTCEQFCLWEQKWRLRYSLCKAEGNGTDTFMRTTCEYSCGLINVKLPSENVKCPKCGRHVDERLIETVLNESSKKWASINFENPMARYYTCRKMNQMFVGHIKIDGILNFKIGKSVVMICEKARTLRFDRKVYDTLLVKEHELVKSKLIEPEVLQNLMGSIHYLAENVTAWMFVSNQFDKNIRKSLSELLEKREELWIIIDSDEKKPIASSVKEIQKHIKSIISVVQQQLETTDQ